LEKLEIVEDAKEDLNDVLDIETGTRLVSSNSSN
jgi:hypothetical protein